MPLLPSEDTALMRTHTHTHIIKKRFLEGILLLLDVFAFVLLATVGNSSRKQSQGLGRLARPALSPSFPQGRSNSPPPVLMCLSPTQPALCVAGLVVYSLHRRTGCLIAAVAGPREGLMLNCPWLCSASDHSHSGDWQVESSPGVLGSLEIFPLATGKLKGSESQSCSFPPFPSASHILCKNKLMFPSFVSECQPIRCVSFSLSSILLLLIYLCILRQSLI